MMSIRGKKVSPMTDAKLKELINMLTIRTAESKLHWIRTGPESKYGIEFNKGRITVDNWVNKGIKYANISIYNKDGYKLEDFKYNDENEFNWYDLVYKLYVVIEKKYLESDFTVDMILDEMK
jgi:hypothetical protein